MRRIVRCADGVFKQIDASFPAERTEGGIPSRHDFVLLDLAPLLERLAEDLETVTLPTKTPGLRVLVQAGMTVPSVALYIVFDDHIAEVIDLMVDDPTS